METAAELLEMLAHGDVTASEVVATCLHRIADSDDAPDGTHAVLAIAPDAMEQATAAVGPLHGVPVLVKDSIEAVGLPGTAGSLALAGRPVETDAPLVARLRAAGAVILGSTNLSEWANIRSPKSSSGWSAVGGQTRNAFSREHSPGGSSSGSGAAIAAGLAPLAVGTETDGSIVCPASLNGVVGIKPTVGAVSTRGVVPISSSQDSPGPLALTVADAALLLDVMSGLDTQSALGDSGSLRVGVVRRWMTGDDVTNGVFDDAVTTMAAHGITIVEVDVPAPHEHVDQDEGTVLFSELLEGMDSYLSTRPGAGVRSLAEVVDFNRAHAEVELAFFGQEHFETALATRGRRDDYLAARARNLEWAVSATLGPALHGVDVLVGCLYGPAWPIDHEGGDNFTDASGMTQAPAIAGWPIASIPMGYSASRGPLLPVGLGVAARPHEEAGLVRALWRIEQVLGSIR